MPLPSAPNRERVERFTWNRHYFHDRTPLNRWRWWLSLAAFLLPLGWIITSFVLPSETSHQQFTHGPIANPHAAWEQRCDACHQSFKLGDASLGGVLSAQAVHDRWNEFRCESCHSGQGTTTEQIKNYAPHHVDAFWKKEQANLACSACHHDHQGRDFSLVKMPDTDCTQCHQDLKQHHVKGSSAYEAMVTSFATNHPEFKGVKPGFQRTLHFNHAHHMTLGIPYSLDAIKNKTNGAFKLADIPEKDRGRFQANADGFVQLECSSCHQLDSGRVGLPIPPSLEPERKAWEASSHLVRNQPGESIFPPRAAGAYYLAINYDAHCKACHPVEGKFGIHPDQGGLTIELKDIRHGYQPKDLREPLRREALQQLLRNKLQDDPTKLPLGTRLDPLPKKEIESLNAAADQALMSIEKFLYAPTKYPLQRFAEGCSKCHATNPGNQKDVPPIIEKVSTPTVWYEHAKFNHASHRAMDCRSCHLEKYQNVFEGGILNDAFLRNPEPVSIPGIANCRECHAPARRVEANGVTQLQGGVRHDCVDCHRYHAGDVPLQGLGSPFRDPPPKRRLDIADLLRGTSKQDHP